MGLGKWRGKNDWPEEVSWIKTVPEMEVLGFVICPEYRDTLRRSWEKVFGGFQRTVFCLEVKTPDHPQAASDGYADLRLKQALVHSPGATSSSEHDQEDRSPGLLFYFPGPA